MADNNHGFDGNGIKLLIYAIGVAAGVGAKLAMMHSKKPISIKDIVINAAVAFAAAFAVYSWLSYAGKQDLAAPISVICGRYGDDVLRYMFQLSKKILKLVSEETKS